MTSSEIFVRHALETRFDDLSAAAVAAAKTFVLDTIGVGVAGARVRAADEVLRAARLWGVAGVSGGAHVFARRTRLPAPSAAFVNGFQIHCQEFDCVHEPAVVHPLATILAALLAECERGRRIGGAELIAATTVAVDAATGLGIASKAPIKFFRPANAGLFGATLGIARLRRFSVAQGLDALGIALAHCAGTMQAHFEGKPTLPAQIGNAARAAVMACDLAEAGLSGPHDVFEGPFGFLTLFEGDYDLAPVLESLGKRWRIAEVSHKPWPTGRAAHGGIQAMLALRERGVTADQLQALTLTAPPLIKRLVGRPYGAGINVNYARLCFQYSGAVALLRGNVGLDDFTDAALADAEVARLAAKIDVIDDGTPDPAAFTPQRAEARLTTGETVAVKIDRLDGSPAAPLSREAYLQKFRRCLAFGMGAPRDDLADAVIGHVDRLEEETDAGVLARLVSGY
jgi:2-methylcitrate dehydratase PrpD